MEILVTDYSPAGSSVCAVKAIVPGLEVETLSYGRIGARNLAHLQRIAQGGEPVLAGIGAAPSGSAPLMLPKGASAAWFDAGAAEKLVGPLFSIYREPGRHAVGLLEEA